MERFKIGQVVRTNEAGGPQMCVVGHKGKLVRCRWWNGTKSVTGTFDPATLILDSTLASISDRVLTRAAHLVKETPRSKQRAE
jgi:uncharacterized protein YodC (DUF2158 family)